MRSPIWFKASGSEEMDQLLPRDELVVSQLPRASMKEKNNTVCCILKQEQKPSFRKSFWSKIHPARSIRREEEEDKRHPPPHGAVGEQAFSGLGWREHSRLISDHVETSSGSFCKC